MNLQLVYWYILSLSNKWKYVLRKNNNKNDQKTTVKKSFLWPAGVEPWTFNV